jgi:hypothetical protein
MKLLKALPSIDTAHRGISPGETFVRKYEVIDRESELHYRSPAQTGI